MMEDLLDLSGFALYIVEPLEYNVRIPLATLGRGECAFSRAKGDFLDELRLAREGNVGCWAFVDELC